MIKSEKNSICRTEREAVLSEQDLITLNKIAKKAGFENWIDWLTACKTDQPITKPTIEEVTALKWMRKQTENALKLKGGIRR